LRTLALIETGKLRLKQTLAFIESWIFPMGKPILDRPTALGDYGLAGKRMREQDMAETNF
jgi:hypothetical protein